MKTIFTVILLAVVGIAHAQNCFHVEHPSSVFCDSTYCEPYTFSKGIYRIPYEPLTDVEVIADHITNTCRPGRVGFAAYYLDPDNGHNVVAAADGWVRKTTSQGTLNDILWMEHPNGEWTMYAGIWAELFTEGEFITAGTIIGLEINQANFPDQKIYDVEFAVLVPVDSPQLVFVELPDYSEVLDYNFAVIRVPLFCDI